MTNSYDTFNRLTQSAESAGGPDGAMARAVAYDDRGNITTLGGLTFIYDMADQPRAVSGTNRRGAAVSGGTYAYDGNLKRVKSVINGVTRYNVYDKEGRLAHVEESDDPSTPNIDEFLETDYLHAAGMTLARIKNTGNGDVFTYMHPDHLGSASAGTKEDGTVAFTEFHTPFGEALLNAAANDNQSDFTGHIRDKDIGMSYMQARYYDPNIGRFASIDPVTFTDNGKPGQFNRYTYTFNDPVNSIDPNGEETVGELRYNPVAFGLTNHAYLIVSDTEAPKGTPPLIFRGGPQCGGPGISGSADSGPSGSQRPAVSPLSYRAGSHQAGSGGSDSSSNGDMHTGDGYGNLEAGSTDYVPGAPDWTQNPAASAEVFRTDESFYDVVNKLEQFTAKLNAAEIPYDPISQNSNSYAHQAVEVVTGSRPSPAASAFGHDTRLEVD